MANKDDIDAEKAKTGEETAVLVEKEPESQEPAVQASERPYGDTANAIESLKKQIEDERRGRLEAEGRANQAAQIAHRARTENDDTNLRLVDNAIETISDQNRNLKAEYARAMQAQDFNRVADIQEAISINAAKLLQLQNGKESMQARPKQPAPQQIADPVEALATQLTPKSASWLRSHPEYARDRNLYAAMVGAHNVAVGRGLQSDSPAYFSEVERVLGIGESQPSSRRIESEDDDDAMSEASQVVSRRSSPPAAPVSRSGAAPGAATPRTIRLTAAQVEVAKNSGMTPEEYWKNLQALKSEGRLN